MCLSTLENHCLEEKLALGNPIQGSCAADLFAVVLVASAGAVDAPFGVRQNRVVVHLHTRARIRDSLLAQEQTGKHIPQKALPRVQMEKARQSPEDKEVTPWIDCRPLRSSAGSEYTLGHRSRERCQRVNAFRRETRPDTPNPSTQTP